MKQIKFFVMALAAMSMFSCSTEEAADATIPDGGDGSTTYAQFTLKMSEAMRGVTANDNNAYTMETQIQDAVVYLMSKGVVEKKIVLAKTGTGATEEWKSTTMKLAAGTRQVVAIVNGGAKFTFDEGNDFSTVVGKLTGDVYNLFVYNDDMAKQSVLFSSKVEARNITGGTQAIPQTIDIPVTRVTSKIIVRDDIKIASTFTRVTYKAEGNTATVGAVTRAGFAVALESTNSHLFQTLGNAGLPVNPTTGMSWGTFPTSPLNVPKVLEYRALAKDGAATKTISGLNNATGSERGGQYTPENVAGKATLNKNVTQLFVRVALRPEKYTNTDNSEVETNATREDGTPAPDAIGNYWVLKHKTDMNKSRIFRDEATFTAWMNFPANAELKKQYEAAAIKYTDGFNYYAVPITQKELDEANVYSVMRNTIYNVTLGALKGFGGNGTGTLVDPDQPVEPEAWLQATVTLQPWTVKDITLPLE